ncbi:MAG: hypothetical protein JWN70_7066 [Planctomycetaceae bacterium]|nr:hypothetical protein [Planctomycetaceae bacterium]
MVQKMWLPLALTMLAGACLVPAQAADKLSTVTPVADLVAEAETKIKDIEALLADNDSYTKAKKKGVPQAAGVLAVLAQSIAHHDEDSSWKKSAADIRDAAIAIAKSGSLDDAKKGLDGVKAGAGGKAGGAKAEHAWDKLIDMDSLMAEVSARNGKLRKAFRKAPEDHAAASRDASVLAVLSIVIESDTHEVKDKADIEKWKKYSKDLQVSMTKISAALKAKNDADGKALFLESAKSCNSCHTDIRDK